MNIEFHYYIVYYLAKKAGFSSQDAYITAYTSQHTDDNRRRCTIQIDQEQQYANYMSQTMDITKPMEELMRVYSCFHFLPGDYEKPTAYRKDGKLHLLNTTPNSENAKKMMKESIVLNSLYRLGIALHVLADTWSHQNFIGCKDYVNGDHKELVKKIIPNIGHADFLHDPDEVSLIWSDDRLIPSNQEIDNKERMVAAAKECFYWLMKYRNKRAAAAAIEEKWTEIEENISNAMGEPYKHNDHSHKHKHPSSQNSRHERVAAYKKLIGYDFIEYDTEEWFNEAINMEKSLKWMPCPRIVKTYTFKEGYDNTHWFKFQESIKEHQTYVRELLDKRLEKMEIMNF